MWLDDPDRWPRLADALERAGEAGIDTETYGQPDRTSPQYRARVHCWSIGLLTGRLSPRGYHVATGVVLPRAALDNRRLVEALGRIRLFAHNAPHDHHALKNEGVDLEITDTLQWLRVAVPGMQDYGLKAAERWALGHPAREGFLDLVKHAVTVIRARRQVEDGCICGKKPCRARRSAEWWDQEAGWFRPHTRVRVRRFLPVPKVVEERWEVPEFLPGHPRWAAWLAYSLADAVHGMELVDWLRRRRQVAAPYPWIKRSV